MSIDNKIEEQMINVAKKAVSRAYAPYSKFRVGAAIYTKDGSLIGGCNVENASYGLTNCAERTAVFSTIAHCHNPEIVAVLVYTPTEVAMSPCGPCRQVLNEFCPKAEVICVCDSDDRIDTTVDQLLPEAFGPHSLENQLIG